MRFYNFTAPRGTDIVAGSRTTSGVLFVVPANRVWKGALNLNAAISETGSGGGAISVSGLGAMPQGAVLQLAVAALATTSASNSISMPEVFIYGGAAGATVTYAAPNSGQGAGQGVGVIME